VCFNAEKITEKNFMVHTGIFLIAANLLYGYKDNQIKIMISVVVYKSQESSNFFEIH
jgi:hypothetical protein